MIQRIQSIYLMIATVLGIIVIFMPMRPEGDILYWDKIFSLELILAALVPLISLITIFLYKWRKVQIGFCMGIILISFVLMILEIIVMIQFSIPAIALIFNALCVVFVVLTIFAIRRDENLVKSVDRIR